MSVEIIKQVTHALKEQYDSAIDPATLRGKVVTAYYKRVLHRLDTICHENPGTTAEERLALTKTLRDFLSDNWLLSYTAFPNSDITQLLVKVAEFVADEENKKGCCVITMSSVPNKVSEISLNGFNSACIRVKGVDDQQSCLIAMSAIPTDVSQVDMGNFNSGYIRVKNDNSEPKLNALYYINKQTNSCVRLTISSPNLAKFDKDTVGINAVDVLSPALLAQLKSLPRHPSVPDALYYVNQQKNAVIKLHTSSAQLNEFDLSILGSSPVSVLPLEHIPSCCGNLADEIAPLSTIKLLMPPISIRSRSDNYDDLGSNSTVLSTHVLGKNGMYLLPVKLLTELNVSAEPMVLHNPYYDETLHPEDAGSFDNLEGDECKRLIGHSPLTQAVFDTKHEYELLTNDTSSLLGQLKQLCRQLGINSASGIGQETNAGGGAYPAIINFMEYYNKLENNQKEQIPVPLKQQIILLLELVTNPTLNINATENLDTCIATRRSKLINTMTGHESQLNQISLSGTTLKSLTDDAKARFDTAKIELINALTPDATTGVITYSEGCDDFSITLELLSTLNIQLNIASLDDLAVFKTLSASEITSVCGSAELRQAIIHQLANLENLVIFVMDMPSDKLRAFLTAMVEELSQNLITSVYDLSAFLISLDVEKCQVICNVLSTKLSDLFKSDSDFRALQDLSPEQFLILNDELLKSSIAAAWFNYRLEPLTQEQRTVIYESMKLKLPDFITSNGDFARAFNHTLQYLTPDQRTVIYESMKLKLLDRVTSAGDFAKILLYLTPEQQEEMLLERKDHLRQLISISIDEFTYVFIFFSPGLRTVLYEIMKHELPDMIASGQFRRLDFLEHLTQDQGTEVYNAIKERLLAYHMTGELFRNTLKYLNTAQRIEVYNAKRTSLLRQLAHGHMQHISRNGDVIYSGGALAYMLEYLPPNQCGEFCNAAKSKLPRELRILDDLVCLFKRLSVEQIHAVCPSLNERVSALIQSPQDLVKLLHQLTASQCDAICLSINDKLGIASMSDFNYVFNNLTDDRRSVVYDRLKHRLPDFVKSVEDAAILTPEQRIDLSHAQTLRKIKITFSTDKVNSFHSALLNEDDEVTKTVVDQLITTVNQRQYHLFHLFSNISSTNQLVDIITSLEPGWLNKINRALGLGLSDVALTHPQVIKARLEQYIATTITPRASL